MVREIGSPVDLHPWNTDFSWVEAAPPFRCLSTAEARRFDELGYVILHDVFSYDEIAAVRATIDRFEAQAEQFLRKQDNGRMMIAESGAITFATHLVTRSPDLVAFACHPNLTDVCVDLVGPDVNLYWDQAVYKKPDKPRRFPWHQDNGYAYVEPQQYLTCWIPLTDATADNGCPQVATGLHRRGTLKHEYVDPLGYECFHEPPVEVHVAEAPVGSAVVFSSLTPHLTGPNTTGDVRKAYILQYAPVGAEVLHGDASGGAPASRVACDDSERQFAVARGGQRVSTPVSGHR